MDMPTRFTGTWTWAWKSWPDAQTPVQALARLPGFYLDMFVGIAIVLIVPTTLMGASLPVLARQVADDPETVLSYTGASTIVCLTERDELARRVPAYADWLRAHQPGRALWFPIRNFRAESADATIPLSDIVPAWITTATTASRTSRSCSSSSCRSRMPPRR